MKIRFLLTILFLLAMSTPLTAGIIVEVHGYLGTPQSWENSRINTHLVSKGWQRGGVVFVNQQGAMLETMPTRPQQNVIYPVLLPSKASLTLQSNLLQIMLQDLQKKHPDDKITLIGHSAGGVVARLTLVRFGTGNVDKLITIAAPHLGTGLADYALRETHDGGPVGFIKGFFGGDTYHTAKSSTGLLVDLVPPRPGSLLYWLNRQPHPPIEYVSIVRGKNVNMNGDQIIPGFSQDMNHVAALRGLSQLYFVASEHELNPRDAELLELLVEDDLHK